MSLGRVGGYELISPLGQGGMADVFRARALSGPHAGQDFALKRLRKELKADPEALAQFSSECELSRYLNHPNIVQVHEVGADGGELFLVMELIDGRDVGQLLHRCRERKILWPVDFAVYLTTVLLDALGYAHRAQGPDGRPLGVVHCDVSPSNFFVSRAGDLKLGDFGVARVMVGSGTPELLGKPFYLSPESLRGEVTPALDLWATAVTMYELLTLRRPFTGKNPDEVFAAIRAGVFAPVSSLRGDVPAVVEDALAIALSPEPSVRFPDARSFAEALEPLYDERVGTPLAISAVVRGLFGASEQGLPPVGL